VGILPAHGLMGAFFSATSMIGFMAGAGIVVRNSIILVDFIELIEAPHEIWIGIEETARSRLQLAHRQLLEQCGASA